MREIKFRAWDKTIEKMYTPFIEFDGEGLTKYTEHQGYLELMQYTGLSDKNGEEIYEGDVVEAVGYRISGGGILKSKMLVEWKDGGFRLKRLYKSPQTYPTLSDTKRLRVVGNIYENPKLLKGSE